MCFYKCLVKKKYMKTNKTCLIQYHISYTVVQNLISFAELLIFHEYKYKLYWLRV